MTWLIDVILGGAWQYIAAGIGVAVLYVKGRSDGRNKERQKAKEADYERAKDIRDRVRNPDADSVSKHDSAGWRD